MLSNSQVKQQMQVEISEAKQQMQAEMTQKMRAEMKQEVQRLVEAARLEHATADQEAEAVAATSWQPGPADTKRAEDRG